MSSILPFNFVRLSILEEEAVQIGEFELYNNVGQYTKETISQEFKEELSDWGKESFNERFPGVDEEETFFFFSEDEFIKKVMASNLKNLSVDQVYSIHNQDRVKSTIDMIKNKLPKKEILKTNSDYFKSYQTMPNAKGKVYNKSESYKRWYTRINGDKEVPPPVVLLYNGRYFHVLGEVRQAAALTAGKILPYRVLIAVRSTKPIQAVRKELADLLKGYSWPSVFEAKDYIGPLTIDYASGKVVISLSDVVLKSLRNPKAADIFETIKQLRADLDKAAENVWPSVKGILISLGNENPLPFQGTPGKSLKAILSFIGLSKKAAVIYAFALMKHGGWKGNSAGDILHTQQGGASAESFSLPRIGAPNNPEQVTIVSLSQPGQIEEPDQNT